MTIELNKYVKISKSSPFYSTQGLNGVGKVTERIDNNGTVLNKVTFLNGQILSYLDSDLIVTEYNDKNKPKIIPTIGMDPELEIFDRWGFIRASNFLSGVNDVVGTDGNSQIAEIRPNYSDNAIKLADNIEKAITKLKFRCDKYFSGKEYIIRVGHGKRCSLGGHVHLGISNMNTELCEAFDIATLLLANLYKDEFYELRVNSSYGKLSDIRNQTWGAEYRTPPSFILNREITEGILCIYHSLSIDVANNELKNNKYYKRLSKWFKNYKTAIRTNYNAGNFLKFGYKMKTIRKMIMDTSRYKEDMDYRIRINNILNIIEKGGKIDEENDVIEEWKLKDKYQKIKILLYKLSDDELIGDLKLTGANMLVNSKSEKKYKGFPIKIFGLKKSRNIDFSTNSRELYLIMKKYIKSNKKNWCLKEEKISESGTGYEIGLGYKIRQEEIREIEKLLNYVVNKIKKDREK